MQNPSLLMDIVDADIAKPKPNSKPHSKAWKVYRRRPKNSMTIWF